MAKSKAKSNDPPEMSWKKLLSDERLRPMERTTNEA